MLAGARGPEDLRWIGPSWAVHRRYTDDLDGADVSELDIHKSVSRLNYSRRCAEASAVKLT